MASEIPMAGPSTATPALPEPDEKGSGQETQDSVEVSQQHDDFPLSWKITALFCGVALSWGSSFSENTLGPLKSTLKMQLGITNSKVCWEYHQDNSKREAESSSTELSPQLHLSSTQSSQLSVDGDLIIMALNATAVPMRDASSFWGWALWIPAIVCFANLLQNILYVWWARSRPKWTHMPTGRQFMKEARERGDDASVPSSTTRSRLRSRWAILTCVPRFFWLVACTQILQAGVVGGFNGLNADIIKQTRGSTDQIAGYTSAVQQVIPVIGAPLIGSFFDFFGYRMTFVSLTSAIWVLVYCLIGYTQTNALGSMVIASVASTMNALPFLASIPLIVPNQIELGLVFGIWKAFNNSGSVIVDMIAGRLQDITSGGTYERVIAFFVAVKGLEFCLGLFYGILDRK
ncbi:major facilitator superfamily domain-containing protein [Fusarium acuminatum]|uniref:Major facilitator superfamily domain-containing protein n=1 Tax=Fusarium acuminatum TaxID=5515 RepID=A0ABZ2X8V9_9HYPO